MRALVTGGAGFIGSHLADALVVRGDEVHVVDDLSTGHPERLNEYVVLHKESVLDKARFDELVKEVRPLMIYHLAAQVDVRASVTSPATDAEVNVIGAINALEAARSVGARIAFSSTGGAMYGSEAPIPSSEAALPAPQSPYGISKYCAEQYVDLYNRHYGTKHAILRFSNVYGPRQCLSNDGGVISILCYRALADQRFTVYGTGEQTRDYVYVEDCVRAFLAARNQEIGGIWNIGTGIESSVLELTAIVERLTGRPLELEFAPPRAGEVSRSCLSSALASHELGWRADTSLIDGIRAVFTWMESGAPDRSSPES